MAQKQTYPGQSPPPPLWMGPSKKRRGCNCGCLSILIILCLIGVLFVLFIFFPPRTNVLLLGIDYTPPESVVGRSDTIIVTTFLPLEPYVGMLSIPRDLWVVIPNVGENRINTAHFFAEAQQPGAGPAAALETVRQNFGVDVDRYMRIRFEGFREVVDALGGVDIEITKSMAGYPPGIHHLTGNKALAFARNRSGTDDFFRMEQGQLIINAVFQQMLLPRNWIRLPGVLSAFTRVVDTNISLWQVPRLVILLLRVGPDGIDNRVISRDMVTPFVTSQGASVLLPNWERINPVLFEMFGQ